MSGTEAVSRPAVTAPAPLRENLFRSVRVPAGWMADARVIPWALAATALLVFSPALLNGFVEWDDHVNLTRNAGYRGLGWTQLRWMLTTIVMGHYIPVTWFTFGLDYMLWGMNPFGYHLTNNLLHAANSAIFYLLALRLLARATSLAGPALRVASVMAALFFALHPLRAESVAWATERRDVLSALFFLLTVLIYLKAADATGRQRRRLLAGSLVCYALALLSKSIVMTLPLILVLLDLYPLGRLQCRWGMWRESSARTALMEKLPYLALGLAGAAISYYAVAVSHFLTPVGQYGWPARLAMTGYSLWFYVEKTVVPTSLSPLYELPAVVNPLEPRFLLSAVAAVAISVLLLVLRRRWPAGLAVWVYYGIILGPVAGLVHAGHQLAHDRYSYLSCLGWALLVGAALGSMVRAVTTGALQPWLARATFAVAAAWILALASLTWYQIQIWRDTETLWRYAVEADPACSICQANVGFALYRRHLLPLAREKYELALTLRPDRVKWHSGLGVVLAGMGEWEPAMSHFRIAEARYPDDAEILTNMAGALMNARRFSEARPHLERANQVDPSYAPALVNLGAVFIETGQPDKALAPLSRALELVPDEPLVRVNLFRAHMALGRYDRARAEYDALAKRDAKAASQLEPALFSVW
jgi:Tfp pilus assembly protein PilF